MHHFTTHAQSETPQNAAAAQFAILRSCHSTISAELQKGGSTYLAAKILVLARLSHKTLSEGPDASPLVESLRNRLALSRTRLLKHIDRNFSNPDVESQNLVENMCAFSLATSSSPTDVLRHYLHIRLEAIRSSPEAAQHMRSGMLKAIRLFKGSLAESQSIFPRRLAEALGKLKLQPLLQDKEIQALPDLNLDLHGRWIAGEVRKFTPWPRHDELQKSEADKMLRSWAPTALSVLKEAAHAMLAEQSDFGSVVKLREDVLEVHLSSNPRIPGVESSEVLDALRDAFNDHSRALVKSRAEDLFALSAIVSSVINRWSSTNRSQRPSLWDLADAAPTLEGGASDFKDAIGDRFYGHDEATKKCMSIYEQWTTSITDTRVLIKSMKEKRWNDDLFDTASEADDDLDLDSRQTLLGEDDPRELNDALDSALKSSLVNFGTDFKDFTASATSSNNSGQPIFLLRVLRGFMQSVEGLGINLQAALDFNALTLSLYESIASSLGQSCLEAFQKSLSRFTSNAYHGSMLWEGHPPLPVQPALASFKLLYQLGRDMAEGGQDLWAPGLIDVMKQYVESQAKFLLERASREIQTLSHKPTAMLAKPAETSGSPHDADAQAEVKESMEDDDDKVVVNGTKEEDTSNGYADIADSGDPNGFPDTQTTTNGSVESDAASKTVKLTQLLFDSMYLQRVLQVSHGKTEDIQRSTSSLQNFLDNLAKEANVEKEQVERMQKSASDYWKKTYLLLGLLA